MGVIAGIIPVTNPTLTVIFKCLAAVKSGNAIVCAPHPRAGRCCTRTAQIMAAAAEKAGAPSGLISCLERVTLASTQELMRHDRLFRHAGGPVVERLRRHDHERGRGSAFDRAAEQRLGARFKRADFKAVSGGELFGV